jgi:hypothetical protein
VELRYSPSGRSILSLDRTCQAADGPRTYYVLYDEFDVGHHGRKKVFTHSLLMTHGREFRIRFSNLRLPWFGSVLLASSNPSEIEKDWAGEPQLATM